MNSAEKPGSEPRNTSTLKNGLTAEQVEKAKAVLAKVNVSEVCRKVNVKRSTIENVLRDKSSQVGELNKVLKVAKPKAETKENVLKELAL